MKPQDFMVWQILYTKSGLSRHQVGTKSALSWHQKGTQFKVLNWPENQVFEKESIEKVPSWSHNGTLLLREKAWYLISMFSRCSEDNKYVINEQGKAFLSGQLVINNS